MSNHCDLIWYNNKIVPFDEATTNVMSHVLHYGSGVFEGIKCYDTPKGPTIFKLDKHILVNALYYRPTVVCTVSFYDNSIEDMGIINAHSTTQ